MASEASATFRAEVLRRDPDAVGWLDHLPTLQWELIRAWHLTPTGPLRYGATAAVLPVDSPEGPAALKVISPFVDAGPEAAALAAFGGDGAVRMLAADHARNALLLEWLDGPDLSTVGDLGAMVRIAGGLARRLAVAEPDGGPMPRLADGAAGWREQLLAQHTEAIDRGDAVDEPSLQRALRAIEGLAGDSTATVAHGDLAPSNVRRSVDGRWIAVDPQGVRGTAAFDAHTVVRGRLATVLSGADPAGQLAALTRSFAEAAGVDAGSALELSFARYVSSYYWESQHQGDPETVVHLRAATTIAAHPQ